MKYKLPPCWRSVSIVMKHNQSLLKVDKNKYLHEITSVQNKIEMLSYINIYTFPLVRIDKLKAMFTVLHL